MYKAVGIFLLFIALATPAAAEWVTDTVAVRAYPCAIAVNPVTNRVFVSNHDSDSVTVIDGFTSDTVTIAAGIEPGRAAVNPVTNRIYVANFSSNTVTVIDGATNATTTVPVGTNPRAVAVNPVTNRIYVACNPNVIVIDGATNATSTVPSLRPAALAVNPVTNRIYVAEEAYRRVKVINGATNDTTGIPVRDWPIDVAVNTTTNKVYVACRDAGCVTVIDGLTRDTASVAVGSSPVALAVNPATNKVYVANSGSNSVTVIDGATNGTTTVAAGRRPGSVAVNPVSNRIYVANLDDTCVTSIDGATNAAANTRIGPQPAAVAVNPVTGKVYVAFRPNCVAVIDGATNAATTTPAGIRPISVAVNPVTDKAYLANQLGNSVTIIDGATGGAVTVAAGMSPIDVAVNPITNRVFVANQGSDNVTVIDGATNGTSTLPAGDGPQAVAVNVVTNRLYVANATSSNVTVVDLATGGTATVPTGSSPTAVAVNPATNKVYVAGGTRGTIVDGATNDTTSFPIGSPPHKLALNPVTNRVYITNYGSNNVTVYDAATGSVATVGADMNPDGVAVNVSTNRAYVANYNAGTVTVIDGSTSAATTLPVGQTGPRSVAVDPVRNKVYVAHGFPASTRVTVLDGATNSRTGVTAGSQCYDIAVNPVNGRVYVANAGGYSCTAITPAPAGGTAVACELSPAVGRFSSTARPALVGKAVNRSTPDRTRIERVLDRTGTSQRSWQLAAVTAGAGSDSVQWAWSWGIDSLAWGANYVCAVALESDGAATGNLGPGTPASGNLLVYPIYRVRPDVGCAAVVTPVAPTVSGTVVTPRARVRNFGLATTSFGVVMHIGSVYFDSVVVADLAPGDSSTVTFDNWVASPIGSHAVRCSTVQAADGNPANDRANALVSVMAATYPDVGCATVVAPAGSINSFVTVTPGCSVMNYGATTLNYVVRMRIDTSYNKIAAVSGHAPGTKLYVTFPAWTAMIPGSHAVTCTTECASDMNSANDAYRSTFVVLESPSWPGTWTSAAPMPNGLKAIKEGGWLAVSRGLADASPYIYGARGAKTSEFYRYSIQTGDWVPAAPIPLGPEAKLPGKGGKATMDDADNLYMVKGNNTQAFWRYVPSYDVWTRLADVPLGPTNKKIKGGSDLAYVDKGGQGYIYLLKGYKDEFWRYRIAGDTWEQLTSTPVIVPAFKTKEGSWLELVEDGADAGRYLYLHKATYHQLFKYDVDRDSWVPGMLTGMPTVGRSNKAKTSKDGGSAATWNGRIYALKGGNSCEFWRYTPAGDTWTELDTIPQVGTTGKKKRVKAGGDIVHVGGGAFFATKGNKTNETWMILLQEQAAKDLPPGSLTAATLTESARLALTPNPARGRAAVSFTVRRAAAARLQVYDRTGRTVATLLDARLEPGDYAVNWDGRAQDLAHGIYFIQLDLAGQRTTMKALLIE